MGKIVISTNVSLDGVVQDPDGEEGFSRGGWFVQHGGRDLEEWGKVEYAEALRTAALLLGRRSDEWFGARWASRPGEWADRLNSLPKYVVSSTPEDPEWTNVTVLKGDVVDEVARLKQQLDGDIVVYASYQLGRTLIEHDLVDELRLFVFPVVVGAGERLFGETSGKKPFRLAGSRTVGNGLAFLTYEIVRDTQKCAQPVIVQLSRASSCDAYGVRALARAACLASQANRAFRLSGPAPALMQIVRTAGSGCALVRWPLGGQLEWVNPQAVADSLARLDQPQAATLR